MRLSYIDTAKLLAVFFVIIGHSCMDGLLAEFLYSFHVQLFFICYGFVYRNKFCSIKEFTKTGGVNMLSD